MRLRTFVAAFAVAVTTTLGMAGVAMAHPGDCTSFATQAEAQAALDADSDYADRLDVDGDGIACEEHFAEAAPTTTAAPAAPAAPGAAPEASSAAPAPGGQITEVPAGGVDTGDGSAQGTGVTALLSGLAAVAVGAVAVGAARRRATTGRR